MSFKIHPFPTNRNVKEQVELCMPRSLSYINNLYQNTQLVEGFGERRTHNTFAKDHLPRTQSTANTSCDPQLRPIMRRRTKSLPSSPERKIATKCYPRCHRVRFADSLGLELAEVKIFNAADYPSIPLHVLSRLSINSDLCCSQDLVFAIQFLQPDFQSPAESEGFTERLQRNSVCLEHVVSSEELGISGTIRVVNLAFEKYVSVRYSFTDWKTYYEVSATWKKSKDASSDVFSFGIPLPPYLQHICSAVQIAIRYQAAGKEYWDNNEGKNYSFTYRSHVLKMPRDMEQSWIHFI
ncbi:protein phosphatase 1 regulatory subunit 3D [Pelobates fuscus]|uniref:protein phosphatase 1 regulatory subunit 3D n=1 Tax=Pelobates fuscus TaxID=191477 RepID=UPI002FE4DBEF